MGNKRQSSKKVLIAVLIVIIAAGFFGFKALSGGERGGPANSTVQNGGDLKILKSEITEKAKFYPYKAGKTYMEAIAVKAKDGTIRTALNTCQVCYDSGRGYYKQQGDELVCQNCGNRFKIEQVEKIKGGCNPVPILKEYKTDDGTNIVIPEEILMQGSELFTNWKKS